MRACTYRARAPDADVDGVDTNEGGGLLYLHVGWFVGGHQGLFCRVLRLGWNKRTRFFCLDGWSGVEREGRLCASASALNSAVCMCV